jgi:osmotically-inducible protein OsmY
MRSVAAFIGGVGLAYFLDPQSGKRRRHVLRDRTAAVLRRLGRRSVRKAKYVAGQAEGVAAEATSVVARGTEDDADDATVKDRILSQAFREAGVGTGAVAVDVSNGVATLRGSLDSIDLAHDLIDRVRAVPGVRTVTPRLTVPGAGQV